MAAASGGAPCWLGRRAELIGNDIGGKIAQLPLEMTGPGAIAIDVDRVATQFDRDSGSDARASKRIND